MDIRPFALPSTDPGEVRFEDPRNVERVLVTFREAAPESAFLSYLHKTWPERRPELQDPAYGSMRFGWNPIDDGFNSTWRQAETNQRLVAITGSGSGSAAISELPPEDQPRSRSVAISELPPESQPRSRSVAISELPPESRAVEFTFKGLALEFPEHAADYDVTFRRTLGVKVDVADPANIEKIEVFTTAEATTSEIRVVLDAGKTTPGDSIVVSGYNAYIDEINAESVLGEGLPTPPQPCAGSGDPRTAGVKDYRVTLDKAGPRAFVVQLTHLKPVGFFSYDEGLVTFTLDHDTFTVSLDSLDKQGPVWYEEEGIFITRADDPTTFEQYLEQNSGKKTTARMVMDREEQSLGNPMNVQPRPHPAAGSLGCKHCCQRFWIEPNGDIVLKRTNIREIFGCDVSKFRNETNGRLYFGLERWSVAGRSLEPGPVLVRDAHLKRDSVALHHQAYAIPLARSIFDDLPGNEDIICMNRLTLRNTGSQPASVEIPLSYSSKSDRNWNLISREPGSRHLTDRQVRRAEFEQLTIRDLAADSSGFTLRGVFGQYQDEQVLRCAVAGDMRAESRGNHVSIAADLAPGEEREIVLKVPYIALDQANETSALAALDFETGLAEVRKFWREECATGAQLKSPEPDLDALYRGHLAFTEITDSRMGDTDLINTSVGTSTYGNYTNESAMIIEELDERGLHDMARQRLNVWLKYQGTVGLKGAFTDHDGVFYGAGGYESGDSYCQHHGWALWCLCNHYMITGDDAWLASIADQLIKGVDWVARQRKVTMGDLPHSRGWERGWLAPGGLEDVDDYFYWLSTNTMTFRGVEYVARVLEAIGHPEAPRVRAEADDYRDALITGFETARRHSPIVRLNDGRWIPHYPSRLYRRGRDFGWIREILEGAVYLLIGELYGPSSREAQWILDDFLDNRYMHPHFGYPVFQLDRNWFDYGGFSLQPCLLPGLMPHLDRDEPEVYMWMFFNSFASCYREEIGGMIEHPSPILGWSNMVAYKTSDEANSVKWLRYMYVYVCGGILHIGRAIPREWLSDGNDIYVTDVATRFGRVGVRFKSAAYEGTITATVEFDQRKQPDRLLVRFRHPGKLPIKSVTVNGRAHANFDPATDNVDITRMTGHIEIVASYEPWDGGDLPKHKYADAS